MLYCTHFPPVSRQSALTVGHDRIILGFDMRDIVPGMEHASDGRRAGSPGVHAALSVLESLVARGPLTLSDLAGELGLAKSTLHRVCAILVERGWVVRDRDGRFDLGIRAIGIGARSSELPIVTAFRGVAAGLLTKIGRAHV